MKHLNWITTLMLGLCCFCAPTQAATAKGNVPPHLAGFTPELSLSLVLREPNFWAGQDKKMSATVTLDGPEDDKKNYEITVSGPANTNVKVTLSVNGANSANITVNLPDEAKPATYIASGAGDGGGDTTKGYSLGLSFEHSQVAIGAQDNEAHQSEFTITATSEHGPMADVEIETPEITAGGLGPDDGVTAQVEMNGSTTDAKGEVKGKFTSGNRLQSTQIGIKRGVQVVLSASVEQVWNALGDDAWSYDPYFYYDESSDITYHMAYNRDGEENISGHNFEPKTMAISGYEWDAEAGEDWDGDGEADGDYQDAIYSTDDVDPTGYDKWSSLVEWGGISESDGAYTASQTIKHDEDFEVDSVTFDFIDTDAFDALGDEN